MKVLVVGAGPAGLAFAILMAEAGGHELTVLERGAADESSGWGITLRNDAMSFLGIGDALATQRLEGRAFHLRGERVVDLPNPAAAYLVTFERAHLLELLRRRCTRAGVELRFQVDVATLDDAALDGYDLVVAADGANSALRRRHAEAFEPTISPGRNWFTWLATPALFQKLTILLSDAPVPLLGWAYRYSSDRSTFIVECSDASFQRSGLSGLSPIEGCSTLAAAFARALGGKPVLCGPSLRWQQFPVVTCRRLVHRNLALIGDAAHTTHFSQGFGTSFAFDDALALASALRGATRLGSALESYEAAQRPRIDAFQATATNSMHWAEGLLDAAEAADDPRIRALIAARWPDNAVNAGPLDPPKAPPRASIWDTAVRGYRVTQMLHVVAKLGVADYLADGPRTATELAASVSADGDALARLLSALVALGVFTVDENGRFGLTDDGRRLRSDVPGSVRAAATLYGEPFWWSAWGGLFEGVRTGRTPFAAIHGVDLFGYLTAHSDASRLFDGAMQLMTSGQSAALVDACGFGSTRVLCDVGGGRGALVSAVLEAHANVSAILFDRPVALAGAREGLAGFVKSERCRLVEGDFFHAVPAGADTYLLKDVLHDWNDEKALAILKQVRVAMAPSARLLVIERVLPPAHVASLGRLVDISMLVLTGGRERDESGYRRLLTAAGLSVRRVVAVDGELTVLESEPG
jgi:2-polyprenyl-6-methoxyphenol hydroxylase-like FAD-dependent oxidoreductase